MFTSVSVRENGRWVEDSNRYSFCVWDLEIFWAERNIFIETMYSGDPDIGRISPATILGCTRKLRAEWTRELRLMSFELWLAFVATSAIILVVPGPTILTVVSYSLAYGRRAYFPVTIAVMLGDSTAIAFSLLGIGTLLATSALLFAMIKWAGGLYLIYLGVKLLTAKASAADAPRATAKDSAWRLFGKMYPVAFLNPKGIVFYVAFFPQFIRPDGNILGQLLVLALTFISLGFVNVTMYSVFAASSRKVLATPQARRGFNLAGGSLLSAAGVYSLLARRPA